MSTTKIIQNTDAVLKLIDDVFTGLDRMGGLAENDMVLDYYCKCAAKDILQARNGLFAAISMCVAVMKKDWVAIQGTVYDHAQFDVMLAEQYKTNNTSEKTPDTHFQSTRSRISVGCGTSRYMQISIDPEPEYLHVKSSDLDGLRHSISKLDHMLNNISCCRTAVYMFVYSADYEGDCATEIKAYVKNVHIPILNRMKDLTYSLIKVIESYLGSYESYYGNATFDVDESEYRDIISDAEHRLMTAQNEIDSANGVINTILIGSRGKVRLMRFPSYGGSAVNSLKASLKHEIDRVHSIEAYRYRELAAYVEAINNIFHYSSVMDRNSGTCMLNANQTLLSDISLSIKAGSDIGLLKIFDEKVQKDNGAITVRLRDILLEILTSDENYADRISGFGALSDEMIGKMIAVYSYFRNEGTLRDSALSEAIRLMYTDGFGDVPANAFDAMCFYIVDVSKVRPEADKNETDRRAIDIVTRNTDWLMKLYRAVGNNTYLQNAEHFVESAEHSREDVIRDSRNRMLEFVLTPSYGYTQDIEDRWGCGVDCASAVARALTEGAHLQFDIGPNAELAANQMDDVLLQHGFIEIPFNGDVSTLETTDVILISDLEKGGFKHTQYYYGDGVVLHATANGETYTYTNGTPDNRDPVGDGEYDKLKRWADENAVARSRGESEPHNFDIDTRVNALNERFGMHLTRDNICVDGLPYIGEVCAARISKVGDTRYLAMDSDEFHGIVLRYTGGLTLDELR
ncbi:LXG domain of WXG superfamily protein [Ruminococcaceae bacterium KH2T8]|nr:LXG domain of WXG superfamily protein [Ruminococcaceae bacterium KH2T8]